MNYIIVFLVVVIAFWFIRKLWTENNWRKPEGNFPPDWRRVLVNKVAFYNSLSKEDKNRFEFRVHEFLMNCRITGIDVDVNITDKLLVASSAIIPIFEFPEWRYTNLYEVLLYPGTFNDKFETSGPERKILGMVGTGYVGGGK